MRRVLILFTLLFVAVACSKGPSVVGKWQEVETNFTTISIPVEYAFFADGTFTSLFQMESRKRNTRRRMESRGRYKVAGSQIVFFDSKGRDRQWKSGKLVEDVRDASEGEERMDFSVTDSVLKLTTFTKDGFKGDSLTFKRVR